MRNNKLRLHDYLYLDEDLVNRLLSQVDGGLSVEEDQTESERTDRKAGLGLAVSPLRGDLGKSGGSQTASSRTVRQTPDSACSRLISLLEEFDSLQYLEAFDQAIWDQLVVGEVVEVQARIEVPMMARMGELATGIAPLIGLMQAVGQEVDHDTSEAIAGITAISGMLNGLPVIASAIGSKHKFIVNLKANGMRIEQDELSGEARILGTLQRKLRGGETWSMLDAMGFAGLPRSLRRDMEKDFKKSRDGGGEIVRAPAALLNPIALYR